MREEGHPSRGRRPEGKDGSAQVPAPGTLSAGRSLSEGLGVRGRCSHVLPVPRVLCSVEGSLTAFTHDTGRERAGAWR